MRAKYLGDGDGRQPEEISKLLGSIIERTQVDVDIRQGELVAGWSEIAPGEWALATPVGVRDRTLLVTVPDGHTATLLRYQHQSLLDAVAEAHGSDLIASVRVRVERPR